MAGDRPAITWVNLIAIPLLCDAGICRPSRRGALPQCLFVRLSEALTWIAFGVPLRQYCFEIALYQHIGPSADVQTLGGWLRKAS